MRVPTSTGMTISPLQLIPGDSTQVAQQLAQAPREWSQFIHHAAASRTAFNHNAAQRVIIVATPDNFARTP